MILLLRVVMVPCPWGMCSGEQRQFEVRDMGLAVRKHLQVRASERFREPVRVGEEEVGFEFFGDRSAVSGDVARCCARRR